MDFTDVSFALSNLNAAVLAVWAHIWPLPSVPHAMLPQISLVSKFQLAQITLHSLFSVSLHVGFNFRLSFESLSALFAYPGAGI